MLRRLLFVFALILVLVVAGEMSQRIAFADEARPAGHSPLMLNDPNPPVMYMVSQAFSSSIATTHCPKNYNVVMGGFLGTDKLNVYFNTKVKNGWRVKAKPDGGSPGSLSASAVCVNSAVPITYQQSDFLLAPRTKGGAELYCKDTGQAAFGVGYKVNIEGGRIFESEPLADGGWLVDAGNLSAKAMKLTVLISCISTEKVHRRIKFAEATVEGKSQKTNSVNCPESYVPMGGGFYLDLPFAQWLVATSPYRLAWRTVAQNNELFPYYSITYAVCGHFTGD